VARFAYSLLAVAFSSASTLAAQSFPSEDPVLKRLYSVGIDSSQVYELAQPLLDSIGPRLTGSPAIRSGNEWLVARYKEFGIAAKNEQYGTWRAWRRGITHFDLLSPRVRTLEAMMLAWSAPTKGKVEGKVIILPEVADSAAFRAWLPAAKGNFVLVSYPQPTCRPDSNFKQNALPATWDSLQATRKRAREEWTARVQRTGAQGGDALAIALADAGAAGVVTNLWSQGWGVDKIFGTRATKAPVVDVSCEDYGLLFRLAERKQSPVVRLETQSESLGEQPVFNTIAEIRGTEKPDEYVMLSAHFDSWDGASGATDNGTGTITMLEAARLLSIAYPKPKRTIIIGHWSGEEQGLNGSRAWAADHPEVVQHLQALFNQDNGTGRIQTISTQGLTGAGALFANWFGKLPTELTADIKLQMPGTPGAGGTDNASFVCYGAPAFGLGSLPWEYFTYTWHTNRDTFDKIVFEEVKQNATLAAMLVYLASEDPQTMPRDRRVMPVDPATGKVRPWPECTKPARASTESQR
jgi:hypothetical protein